VLGAIHQASDAKVSQQNLTFLVNHNVGRFQIPMDHFTGVGVINGLTQGQHYPHNLFHGKALALPTPRFELVLEGGTIYKLQHHIVGVGFLVKIHHLHNVGVTQFARCQSFTLKSIQKLFILAQMAVHHLDGDIASQTRLIGFVDLSHPALAQPGHDAIFS
jgi:hypothetical protein